MGAVGIASLCAALVAAAVLGALLALLVPRAAGGRRRDEALQAELAAARAEAAELRERVAALEPPTAPGGSSGTAEFLITDIGRVPAVPEEGAEVPDRLVLSATLGEPMVRAAALAHGLGRALSAESRNRIRFAMRQHVRRTRRQRRREMKRAWRESQAQGRSEAQDTALRQAQDFA